MRIKALDIVRWADSLDCRAELPALVRRLVHATGRCLRHVDVAAGYPRFHTTQALDEIARVYRSALQP